MVDVIMDAPASVAPLTARSRAEVHGRAACIICFCTVEGSKEHCWIYSRATEAVRHGLQSGSVVKTGSAERPCGRLLSRGRFGRSAERKCRFLGAEHARTPGRCWLFRTAEMPAEFSARSP